MHEASTNGKNAILKLSPYSWKKNCSVACRCSGSPRADRSVNELLFCMWYSDLLPVHGYAFITDAKPHTKSVCMSSAVVDLIVLTFLTGLYQLTACISC